MIHYINISKKRLVGRNNQPSTIPLILDFHTLGDIQFCLIDDKNQVRSLPENCTLTFAGSVKMGENSSNILFLSTTYTVSEDNVINFTVDTYTEPFLTQIKKKNTEINVEISIKFEDGHQKLLLRDYAYACPRVYIEGLPPSPVDYYYTKEEVDAKLDEFQPISGMVDYALKSDVPTKTSELVNDSGFITSGQVDFSDYYTKEETDLKLDEKADIDALSAFQPVSGMVDYALKSDVPTKTSELVNDSGYITSGQVDFSDYYTKEETDLKLDEKADVDELSAYYTKKETDLKLDEKADTSSLSAYQPVSGMSVYALKTDVPTKTSDLTNDSGYITSGQVDFSDYYTKEETDNKFATKQDLPTMNAITIDFGDRISEGEPTRLQYGDRL